MYYKVMLFTLLLFFSSCSNKTNQKQKKELKIGFSQCTMSDRWRHSMVQEMRTEIDFISEMNISLIVKDAKNNNEKQIEDIKALIEEGIDLLIVSPNESKPITPIIESLYKKGIPIIIIDRKIETDKYTAYIGADNLFIGEEAGKFAIEELKHKGKIIEITGLKGSSPSINRGKGFNYIINTEKNIEIIEHIESDWSENDAFVKLDEYLTKNINPFNLVFAHNDYMGRGAFKALKKHGLEYIPIIGIDGLYGPEQGINMVYEKILCATFLYPTGGDLAIQIATNILTNQSYAKTNVLKTTRIDQTNAQTVLLQSQLITNQQLKITKQSNLVTNQKLIISQQQKRLLLFYLIAFLLASIAFIFIYTYRLKNKSNKLLKEKNKKIQKQNKKIVEQQQKLIEMVKIAENATETKLQFFTNISHEFRTLISLISLPVKQILDEYKGSDKITETLKNIDLNTDRLVELSEEVLDFRKIEKSSYKLDLQPHNIKLIIENRIKGFQSFAEKRTINLDFHADELIFDFDRRIIEKIFNNLLSNALKYSPDSNKIAISISHDPDWVIISIEDFGPGIPEDKLPHIFNRFEQHDFDKEINLFGSGIGLAYTKELITFHNGEISIKNKPAKGIISEIKFPFKKSTNIINEENNNTEIENSMNAKKNKATVLIVEDNDHLRQIIRNTLQKEYNVIEAIDGQIALDKIKKIIPDIVVSDILMPRMDGIQLCQKIKTTPSIADLPVILLTALATHEATIEGFNTGADAYLTKPFNQEVLRSRIKNLLENRKRIQDQFYKITHKQTNNVDNIKDKDFIENIKKIIEKQLDRQNLNIEFIAQAMNMSHSTLYRNLKKATGLKSVDFIKMVRLENAARMLMTTQFNVEEICYLTGFSDPKYFRKCFIKQYEKTPSEFRKNP